MAKRINAKGDLSYQNAEKDSADSCTVTVSNNEIEP